MCIARLDMNSRHFQGPRKCGIYQALKGISQIVCIWWYILRSFFCVLYSATSKLMQSIYDPCMNCCAGTFTLKWNIKGGKNSIILLHVVIAKLKFHLMCIHVHEWISNHLSFFSLVFTGGFLCSTRTFCATLAIFVQPWAIRGPCRFLPSACILKATDRKSVV